MSSPNTPRVPALIRGSHPKMPSVAWFNHLPEDEFFLICDPAGKYEILDNGTITSKRGGTTIGLIALVMTLGIVIWAVINAAPFGGVVAMFLLGGGGGLITGMFIAHIADLINKKSDRTAGRDVSFKVTMESQQAWRLCSTVAKLARVESWADGTVDTARRAPSILWSAVGRSIALDQQCVDAARALKHPALEDLAKETLSRVDRERQPLNAAEASLNQVLEIAIGIDQKRVQTAGDKRLAEQSRREDEQRRQEERELRGRLAGYETTAAPQVSDTQEVSETLVSCN